MRQRWAVRLFPIFVLALFSSTTLVAKSRDHSNSSKTELPASDYLVPQLQNGQKLSNIFSRTIDFKGQGFDELVRRVSGTDNYSVISVAPDAFTVSQDYRYDGLQEGSGDTVIKDGGRTICFRDKCSTSLEASGLSFNPNLWGRPSGPLHAGMSWNVELTRAWELGPAGKQTVTVISVDSATRTVTLQREGNGDGFFDHDFKQVHLTKEGKTFLADVKPGPSHWIGLTTFQQGIIVSDEPLVQRPITLTAPELGSVSAVERQYILLNKMPSAIL